MSTNAYLRKQFDITSLKLLNVRGIHYIRQIAIYAAEPLVLEPGVPDFEMVVGKLNRY